MIPPSTATITGNYGYDLGMSDIGLVLDFKEGLGLNYSVHDYGDAEWDLIVPFKKIQRITTMTLRIYHYLLTVLCPFQIYLWHLHYLLPIILYI